MSQFGIISNTNPQQVTNTNTDNNIKENDNLITDEIKKNYEEATSLDKAEKLGGPKPPKPESTMHKVGRFLTGILGGLLLAAGVAAAVAATVASCGIAAGVVAGVAATVVGAVGITGTSVIAGAAGAAGIGLIAGSRAMKPKNPVALQPQTEQKPEMQQKVSLKDFGADDAKAIEKVLTEKYGYDVHSPDDNSKNSVTKSLRDNAIRGIIYSVNVDGGGNFNTVNDRMIGLKGIRDCVTNALELHGLEEPFEATEKNILLVRHAIDSFVSDDANMVTGKQIDALNNPQVKKDLNEVLNFYMEQQHLETDEPLIAIFRGALNLESVEISKPQQNPVDEVPLIKNEAPEEIRDISISRPAEKLPFGNDAEKEVTQALQNIDPNISPLVIYDNKLADPVFESLADIQAFIPKADEVASFVTDVLKGNGVHDLKPTPKNILLVRRAIIHHCWLRKNNDVAETLNSTEGRKLCADRLQTLLKRKMDDKTRDAIAIFKIAVTEADISNIKDEDTKLIEQNTVIQP